MHRKDIKLIIRRQLKSNVAVGECMFSGKCRQYRLLPVDGGYFQHILIVKYWLQSENYCKIYLEMVVTVASN
jgi:hypothetical protein